MKRRNFITAGLLGIAGTAYGLGSRTRAASREMTPIPARPTVSPSSVPPTLIDRAKAVTFRPHVVIGGRVDKFKDHDQGQIDCSHHQCGSAQPLKDEPKRSRHACDKTRSCAAPAGLFSRFFCSRHAGISHARTGVVKPPKAKPLHHARLVARLP